MRIKTALSVCAAASALFASAPASAVTFTFASFSFVGPTKVHYDNATGLFTGSGVEINFNYVDGAIVGTPSTGYDTQSAVLSFTAHALGPVNSFGSIAFQELQLDSFSITRTTPFNGMSNLLSGSATTGALHGELGGSTAAYISSMGAGASIFYESDFLSFPPPIDADLSWTLTSVTPPLGVSGSNFATFDASIAGTFGWNAQPSAIPEPGPIAMLLGAGVGGTLILRKRPRVRT